MAVLMAVIAVATAMAAALAEEFTHSQVESCASSAWTS